MKIDHPPLKYTKVHSKRPRLRRGACLKKREERVITFREIDLPSWSDPIRCRSSFHPRADLWTCAGPLVDETTTHSAADSLNLSPAPNTQRPGPDLFLVA